MVPTRQLHLLTTKLTAGPYVNCIHTISHSKLFYFYIMIYQVQVQVLYFKRQIYIIGYVQSTKKKKKLKIICSQRKDT